MPKAFGKALYRGRARIEQAIGKLKRFKRIARHCEKTKRNFGSFVAIAAAFILVKSVHRLGNLGHLEHHDFLGVRGVMMDRGKGAFDRVAGADMLPVLGREIIEGEQDFPILGQTIGGLVVLRPVLGKKTIEGLLGIITTLDHPDLFEARLGSGLHGLGELVEDFITLWTQHL